jgi:hypothetical protein
MARQDESDDLEASTITAMEASQAFSRRSAEMESVPESEIQAEETVEEAVSEAVREVEEHEVDDTEAFETASVVTVQSIHSVIPIEHSMDDVAEPNEVEVEHDSHVTETTEEPAAPILDAIHVADMPVEESPEEIEPEIDSTQLHDPIPGDSPEEPSIPDVIPTSHENEHDNETVETMAEDEPVSDIPAIEETSEAELPKPDHEPASEENFPLHKDPVETEHPGEIEHPVEEGISEPQLGEVTETRDDTPKEEIPTEEEPPAFEEPITVEDSPSVEETPFIDETPETTITEKEMTPHVSEIESTEEDVLTPPMETSQDEPLSLSKGMEEPLQHGFLVNTAAIEMNPVDLLGEPHIVDDKDRFPLIEVHEIKSSPVGDPMELNTATDSNPQDLVPSEHIERQVSSLPKTEEFICDDAISELNIPAPITALPIPVEESLLEVPESESPVAENVVDESTEEGTPDVEEDEIPEDLEKSPTTETMVPEEEVPEEEEPTLESIILYYIDLTT